MATLNVSLELASPLLVGEPRQGNTYTSYSFLPGSVLRGAVAAVLMQEWSYEQQRTPHPEACPDRANCPFCRLLYPQAGRPPRFYDCYPAVPGGDSVQPFPHTARSCKRHPGFIRPDDAQPKHGIFDTLIAQAAARDAAESGQSSPYLYSLDCPACDQPLKAPPAGYYGRIEEEFYTARPQNRRFSRTAINRRRHTAQAGQLFTLTVMGEQMKVDLPEPFPPTMATRLQGVVETGDADSDALKEALAQVRWLGSGNSRGLGQLSAVQISQPPAANGSGMTPEQFQRQAANGRFQPSTANGDDLINRVTAFNQAIDAERTFYKKLGVDVLPGRWYFTIDLLSDTFVRQNGLPTLDLTAAMLDLTDARQDFVAVEPVERGGWANAWGLPRPRKLGIGGGGVFLFRVDDNDPDLSGRLLKRLAELEESGVGEDRARGAGRLRVCAPFHKEVNPK